MQTSVVTTAQSKNVSASLVVEQFFGSVAKKDYDELASLVSSQVDWYIFESPILPWTGKRTGREQIPGTMRLLDEHFVTESDSIRVDKFIAEEEDVIVVGTAGRTVRATGKSFTTPFVMHFTVEEGLITKFLMYEETLLVEAAFRL